MAPAVTLSALVVVINRHRIPDIPPLDVKLSVRTIQPCDLAGITALSGRPAFAPPGGADPTVVRQSRSSFDPRHWNITLDADKEGIFRRYLSTTPADRILAGWWGAVASDPGTCLARSWAIFRGLVGLAPREVFYPTHGGVDPNEFGDERRPGWGSHSLLYSVGVGSGPPSLPGLSCRVWAYQVAGLAAMLVCVIAAGALPSRSATRRPG